MTGLPPPHASISATSKRGRRKLASILAIVIGLSAIGSGVVSLVSGNPTVVTTTTSIHGGKSHKLLHHQVSEATTDCRSGIVEIRVQPDDRAPSACVEIGSHLLVTGGSAGAKASWDTRPVNAAPAVLNLASYERSGATFTARIAALAVGVGVLLFQFDGPARGCVSTPCTPGSGMVQLSVTVIGPTKRVVYGDAQLSVPLSWFVTRSDCISLTAPGTLMLAPAGATGYRFGHIPPCGPAPSHYELHSSVIQIGPIETSITFSGDQRLVIHGITVYVAAQTGCVLNGPCPVWYVVPSLHVEIFDDELIGISVLNTLQTVSVVDSSPYS